MVKDFSPQFDEQVTLFDIHEHTSGQFVWVLVEKTTTTTFFFEHESFSHQILYINLNIICLGLARKSSSRAYF
jgi:hypothetical protein